MLIAIHTPAGIRMKSRNGRFGGRIEASPSKRRFLLGRSLRLEPLEDRSLLSISYVDNNLAHWTMTNDQNVIGTLDVGDTVTWNYGQSNAISGLVYGTDAFGSIQEAIDAAAWGDTVNVEAGTYAEQLTINKSLDLIGAGESTTTIFAPPTVDRTTVTYGSTVHDYIVAAYATTTPTIDVRIEGFTIDANNTASKVTDTGWFDGVFLRDVNDDGGTVAGLFSSTIEGFTTTAYESWGAVVFGDSELTLHDNTITEFTRDGIDVFGTGGTTGQPNVTISDNVVAGSATGLNGIAIEDHAAAILTGNIVTGMARSTPWAGVGILAWNADNVIIGGTELGEGNQVDDNFYGIFVNTSENVEVVGNTLTHNINRAITLDDADNNTVARNIIVGTAEGTEDAGIALLNGATGNMIGGDTSADGNTITLATSGSHLLYAIYLPNNVGAGSNTIKNNSIQGGMRAVQVDTGNTGTTTITGNKIGDVVAPSFGGIMANGGNLVVTGNTLTNAVRPIEFWGVGTATVTGNYIYGATFDAINVGSVATGSTFSNNTISGLGTGVTSKPTAGINVRNGNSGLTINGNQIDNMLNNGIQVAGGSGFAISDNVISYLGSYVAEGLFGAGILLGAPQGEHGWYTGLGTHNSTISGNEVSYSNEGIDLYYASHNQITGNNLHDLKNDGMWLQDASDNTITENTVTGVHDGTGNGMGIAVYGTDLVGGVPADGGSDRNAITANTVTDCDYGLLALDLSEDNTFANNVVNLNATAVGAWTYVLGRDPVDNVFHENDLSGNTRYFFASDTIDASCNWFGTGVRASTVAAASEGISFVDISPMLDHGDSDALTAGFQADYSSLTVTTLGAQLSGTRIQEGVSLVDNEGVVHVDAGTYTELLAIDKSLDLIGEGSSTTTIDGDGGDTVVFIDSGTADWVVSLVGFTITGGESSNYGGGICNWGGTLTVDSCVISGNSASQIGGGIFDNSSGPLTIRNSTISNNTSNYMGGGIGDWGGCTVVIENSTISDNAAFDGGGISAMQSTWTIRNTTIDGNSTYTEDGHGFGGGIMNWDSDVTLEGCTISNNTATYLGGGIQNQSTMTLISSTLFGNTALHGAGISSIHEITIQNSTIANNTATGAVDSSGGGILYQGIMTIANSTIAGNAAVQGGGIYNNATTIAEMKNSIVADNTSSDASSPDIYGTITANYCLIEDMTGATLTDGSAHNLLDVDPLLGTLGYYESGIQTIPLLKGSPALNAGSNALIPDGMTTDERGFNRIFRVIVDMGAHEVSDPSVFGTLPVVTLTAPAYTNNTTPTVYIHATPGDEGKLPSGTTVYLDVDLNDDSDYEDPGEQAYCTGTLDENGDSVIIVTPALAQGSYEMKARVTDTLYNEGISIPTNVVIDLTAPTVTVNRASTQPETTSKSPIYFTVVFSKIVTGFSASGVVFSGTAPGTLSAVVTGSGTTYTVAVSGMTGTGTVAVSLKAGAARDLAGNASEASTSTHNSVNFISGPAISNVSVSAKTSSDKTNIAFNVVDNQGISSVQLMIDGKNASIRRISGDKYSATYAYSGLLTAGAHTFSIRAVSSRGTSIYTNSFTVAASTPTISSVSVIASKSDKPTTFSWRVFTIDGIRAVKISIDGGTAVTVQKSSGSSTSAVYMYSALLSARTHTYTITAVGATGKAATPYTGRVTVVGTTPLIVNVKATAKTSSSNTTIKWTVYDIDGIGSTTLKIDGRKITSGITHTGSSTYITYTYTGKLSAGRHSYTINATDASVPQVAAKQFAGNVTVAASVPTITHIVVTPTKARTTITWTASDIDGMKSVVLKIDGRSVSITKSGDNYSYSGKLSVGRHTYSITATSTLKKSATVSGNLTVRNTLNAPHSSFATALSKTTIYSHSLLDDETTASVV